MGYKMGGFSGFGNSPVKKLTKEKVGKGLDDLQAGMNQGVTALAKGGQSAKEAQDEAQTFDVDKPSNKLSGGKALTQNKHTTCPAYGGKGPGGTADSQSEIRKNKTRR